MLLWLGLLVGGLSAGACLVGLLVLPRRIESIAVLGALLSALLAVRSFSAIARASDTHGIGLAVFFLAAGMTGGYWVAAAALLRSEGPAPRTPPVDPRPVRVLPAVIVLSCAEAPRYRIASTARVVDRLVSSGAVRLPTSALPFVFLSEKTRYRALGGYNPARATVTAIADGIAREIDGLAETVEVAWCDSTPNLRAVVADLGGRGYRSVVLLMLGPDGSFPMWQAERNALPDMSPIRLTRAPSIWHSDELARRLADRIIATTSGVAPSNVGVVLAGEGQPTVWTSVAEDWSERENYFNQRVRLMLAERGIDECHVLMSWIEWQTPDITESVRHLAALGCRRIVIAPSTLPYLTLASALDLKHLISAARLPDDVLVVTLTPWGDDASIVHAAAKAVRDALERLAR